MARYVTKVLTSRSPDEVFAYMADLRNFAEWDPGVRHVAQVEGEGGGPGAVFDVTVRTKREQTLRYRTAVFDPPHELLVVAKTKALTSEDRITVGSDGRGSIVIYDAALRLNGPLRVGSAVLYFVFRRIGDRVFGWLMPSTRG